MYKNRFSPTSRSPERVEKYLIKYAKDQFEPELANLIANMTTRFNGATLKTLIDEYHIMETKKLETHPPHDLEAQQEWLTYLMVAKLGLPLSLDYYMDCIYAEFEKLEKAFKELEKYNNHRHKTIHGLYTEKPVY